MTGPRAGSGGTTHLSAARDERLVPYTVLAIGALAGALITGNPGMAVLAAPFVLALTLGLRRIGTVAVDARVILDSDQVLEGDFITGRIRLEWQGTFNADVLLHRLAGVAVTSKTGARSWSLPRSSGMVELEIELQATEWGRHTVGEVWLRLASPQGLLVWSGKVAVGPTLRVLPSRDRLTRLLDPADAYAVLGVHRSKRLGDGHDFAELRPYTPGDRLRDLNWGATARHRQPFVNRYHPERSGEVVIALDFFVDDSVGSTRALAGAARVAWALANVHLQANDRVGLVGLGGRTQWLPPGGGRMAKYRLLETLLSIGGEIAESATRHEDNARISVPASALVVVLTPLHDRRTVGTLAFWRARGRSVAVIAIETRNLLGDSGSAAETLARRLWALEIDGYLRTLARLGIPVVTMTEDAPPGPVVSALRRARQGPAVRAAR